MLYPKDWLSFYVVLWVHVFDYFFKNCTVKTIRSKQNSNHPKLFQAAKQKHWAEIKELFQLTDIWCKE